MYRCMSNQDCNYPDLTVNQATEQTPKSDSWIAERPVETAELPETVAENTSRFYDVSIESLDDMIAAIRNVVEGDGIAIDELCHVEGKPPTTRRRMTRPTTSNVSTTESHLHISWTNPSRSGLKLLRTTLLRCGRRLKVILMSLRQTRSCRSACQLIPMSLPAMCQPPKKSTRLAART